MGEFPHLYALLMKQAFARVPYGIDENERQLHTRTRPKVVLARTFAEAEALVERYKPFLHGVISDLQVAVEGKKGQETGTPFLRRLLDTIPGLPILLSFCNGHTAIRLDREASDQEVIAVAMKSLRAMFGDDIPEPEAMVFPRWLSDPWSRPEKMVGSEK